MWVYGVQGACPSNKRKYVELWICDLCVLEHFQFSIITDIHSSWRYSFLGPMKRGIVASLSHRTVILRNYYAWMLSMKLDHMDHGKHSTAQQSEGQCPQACNGGAWIERSGSGQRWPCSRLDTGAKIQARVDSMHACHTRLISQTASGVVVC